MTQKTEMEMFDEKYSISKDDWSSEMGIPSPHNVKNFIHQKHREYIEKKIVELKGMIKECCCICGMEKDGCLGQCVSGYNSALSDIIANYKKELTEIV